MDIKVRDKVETIPMGKWDNPTRGVVRKVWKHNPKNPREDHGSIEVKMEDGITEHFAHYKWHKLLKVIK
jgi:hypothetical protein